MNRRSFIKRGALWVPAVFIPKAIRAQGNLINPYRFAGAGGGGGPFAFVKSVGANNDANDTNMSSALATVTAGNLIVAWFKYEGAPTTITLNDGTTTFTARTLTSHANGDLNGQFHYLLSSVASGSVTYTGTFAAARAFKRIIIFEIDTTGSAAYDTEALASGTSVSPSSGNLTTAVANSVVLGGYGEYNNSTLSVRVINGVANENNRAGDNTTGATASISCVWENVFSSTFTGAASATLAGSDPWVCNAIAFK